MKENIDPKMHTVEHILNQTMVRLFDCGRCFSAHIEKKKSKCDYHFDRALTPDEIKAIEDEVNEIIAAGLPISEEFVSLPEAKEKYDLERLPEGCGNDEKFRVIKVGDYDAVLCAGPHLVVSSEAGHFRIISSDQAEGVLRVRFKLADSE